MNKAADQKMALAQAATMLTAVIRRSLIEAAEGVIATIGRIAVQEYPQDIAEHAVEQLRNLSREIGERIRDDKIAIERLSAGLERFERRLADSCRGRD